MLPPPTEPSRCRGVNPNITGFLSPPIARYYWQQIMSAFNSSLHSSFHPSLHPSFGAQLIAPDRTRFRLWAPSKQQVALEVEGMAPIPMQALADGWCEIEAACGAGARYRYRVAGDLAVPDPASRLQQGDVHDASIVCDPNAYRWKHENWQGRPWHEVVLYELHVGALGGFHGVRRQLPALAGLGFTAIELMPVADSRAAQLGLRRRAAVRAGYRLRHAGRIEGVDRCRARAGHDGVSRRGL